MLVEAGDAVAEHEQGPPFLGPEALVLQVGDLRSRQRRQGAGDPDLDVAVLRDQGPVERDLEGKLVLAEGDRLEADDVGCGERDEPGFQVLPPEVARLPLHILLEGAPLAGQELVLLADPGDELGLDEPVQLGLDAADDCRQVVGGLSQRAGVRCCRCVRGT